MSSDERELNPYAAPKEAGKSGKRVKKKTRPATDVDDNVIQDIVRSFQKTRSWISFFGVLSYLGAVVLVIAGVALLLFASAGKSEMAIMRTIGPGIFVVYLIIGAAYAAFGSRLFRYRDAIDNVIRSDGRMEYIAEAVERQANFWTLAGQTAIVIMGMYMIFGVIGGMLGASSR